MNSLLTYCEVCCINYEDEGFDYRFEFPICHDCVRNKGREVICGDCLIELERCGHGSDIRHKSKTRRK